MVVSERSHGFIEKVTRLNKTSNMVFMETELERCTENSTWTRRFRPRIADSASDDGVFCAGGDNSYGLMITESDADPQHVSTKDSIIGRTSYPVLAKVVGSYMNGDFWMIEVLPVLSVENGTAVTMVKLDQLHKNAEDARETIITIESFRFRKLSSRSRLK